MTEITRRDLAAHVAPSKIADHPLSIVAMDVPGFGGANHHYVIEHGTFAQMLHIHFQNGPIPEAGVNGVTNEALLAIVADRLEGFESGPFACNENADALAHIQNALRILHKRTEDRVKRGVEGTHSN